LVKKQKFFNLILQLEQEHKQFANLPDEIYCHPAYNPKEGDITN